MSTRAAFALATPVFLILSGCSADTNRRVAKDIGDSGVAMGQGAVESASEAAVKAGKKISEVANDPQTYKKIEDGTVVVLQHGEKGVDALKAMGRGVVRYVEERKARQPAEPEVP